MVDVVLSTNDLTVLGGPASISVDLDIGTQGSRGSYIFTGDGKPDDPDTVLNFSAQVNDLYINLKPSDNEYLFLYQYVSNNGVLSWQRTLRLVPNTSLYNPPITFVNGYATTSFNGVTVPEVLFPVNTFFPTETLGDLTAQDFNLQYSILGDKPISSAINVSDLTTTYDYSGVTIPLGATYLPIQVIATEYDIATNTWSPLNGEYYIHTLITIGGKV